MSKLTGIKILLWMVLSLVVACNKDVEVPSTIPEVQTVHYRASIRTHADTRATLGDGMEYKYATGDRVYLESEDGNLYGFLDMDDASGIGSHEAYFEGILTYTGTLPMDPNPQVRLVLVSGTDDLHTVTGGKVDAVTAGSYGQDKWAPSLEDAVSRLSHFTGSGNLMDDSFTLQQQSSFLRFSVNMTLGQAPVGRVITARLLNNNVPLREVSVSVPQAGKLPFVFAFLGGDVSLESAKLVIEWTDAGNTDQSKDFDVADQTLAANTYYTVTRYTYSYDGFRIKATQDNTTITFNYNYADSGIEYSVDYGDNWIHYTQAFTLNKGEVAWIKGNRSNYKNEKANDTWWNPADKPIFRASGLCYISGNVMSLLSDQDNLTESAFQGAFSRGTTAVNYIDIDPDDPLILPVRNLAKRCYMRMFHNCTSLTTAPTFRVEGTAEKCCYNMFRKCSNLTDVSGIELPAMTLTLDCYRELIRECTKVKAAPVLPAKTLVQDCYRQMFSSCSSLKTVVCLATDISAPGCITEWMSSGVPGGGTFYKAPGVTYPSGVSGILNNWTVVEITD